LGIIASVYILKYMVMGAIVVAKNFGRGYGKSSGSSGETHDQYVARKEKQRQKEYDEWMWKRNHPNN
jgi:hypothetical protein